MNKSCSPRVCVRRQFRLISPWMMAVLLIAPGTTFGGDEAAVHPAELAALSTGALVICGGGYLPDEVRHRFVELAGGEQAQLVVVTTASDTADSPDVERYLELWRKMKVAALSVLHTRSRETANDPAFSEILKTATGVWFLGGSQSKVTDTYLGTVTERLFHAVVERGGVIGGTSAGAAIMSPVMIRRGNPEPEVGKGFGFLPGCVVDQHFMNRNRQPRLMKVLAANPGLLGLGIDEGTALIVQGRRMNVMGESHVAACLAPSANRPARVEILKPGTEADLTTLIRAAVARNLPPNPSLDPPAPEVAHGTLVIVGGGTTPPEAARRFVAAAGGPDALVVVVTTALGPEPPAEARIPSWLFEAGAKNVRRLHAQTTREANAPATLELLRQARGIWFMGGRQWRLVDAYLGTEAERLFHKVLDQGGVVGGTSAGASIQARYLVRGNPLQNAEVITEGYEQGFGFLRGVAIDQHFSQRNRFDDMALVKQAHPQLIGLGVDDSTALIVTDHTMEVVGRNQVAVYADREIAPAAKPGYEVLHAGMRYDLKNRVKIEPATTTVVAQAGSSQTATVAQTGISEPAEPPEANDAAETAASGETAKALICE